MMRTPPFTTTAPTWLGLLMTALLLLCPLAQAAGLVTVSLRANGDLVLTGDGSANGLLITASELLPVGALIVAQGETLLEFEGETFPIIEAQLVRHLIINLGAGDDVLMIGGDMVLPGDLRISDPAGKNILQIMELIVAGKTHLRFGGERAIVEVLGLLTSGPIVVGATGGHDVVVMQGCMTLGSLRIAGGAGRDLVAVVESVITRGLALSGGAGSDASLVVESSLGGVVNLEGGDGRDMMIVGEIIPAFFPSNPLRRITMRTGGSREPLAEDEPPMEAALLGLAFTPQADISITGGEQVDSLAMQQVVGASHLRLRSSAGHDLVLGEEVVVVKMTIDTGRGNDELLLNRVGVEGLLLGHLGHGNDFLEVGTLISLKVPRFDGGNGEDTVTDYLDHELPSDGPKFLNFEIVQPPDEEDDEEGDEAAE